MGGICICVVNCHLPALISSAPRAASLSLISGLTSTARRSSLILRTIASGVPTGATTHCQPTATKPGSVSATVGKSGRCGRRFSEATANALSWPDS